MANSSPPNAAPTPLKQLAFAFPFRKKGQGNGASATDITDEHDMYLLLKQEPSGSFPVSASGMWHGGIHISEAGAGQALDLKGGVRCIADGEVIAWRLNRQYLVSTLPAQNGQPEINAQYSTGFALVQHSMEFPRGTKLTFFSLYMHLQDYAGYEADPALPWAGYWSAKYQVTQDTVDKPTTSAGGQAASTDQTGLRVRVSKPHGATVGILPQGTLVSLSRREGDWGQIADDPGALIAPTVGGHVDSRAAIDKWIFLGKEHGHAGPVVKAVMPDSVFDCVNVVPEGQRTTVKAGDVLGYLGRYDSLRDQTSNRMVHIEAFSDDSIKQFITDARAGVTANITTPANWSQLGLSADPTILRIFRGTTLYDKDPVAGTPPQASAQAKQTDVIQVEAFAVLQKGNGNSFLETSPGNDGQKRHWWKVESADVHRQAISGWVREQSFAGGTVTREYPQSWIDFKCHDEDHDPTHTIFASTADYVAYAAGSDDPTAGSVGKLSPLMTAIYRELYPTGDGADAVNDLRNAGQNPQGSAFPWVAFRASRFIPKHESEWANPAKWQELVSAIEERTGPQPEHEEEKKRIAKLVWWDEVKAGVTGFPEPDVFHLHPVALVGNFLDPDVCACGCCLGKVFSRYRWTRHRANHPPQTYYGPVYTGTKKLDKFTGWDDLIAQSKATQDEKAIVIAMSSNEGNMDAVQAWDWQTFSAGAMQKTVTPEGYGELPQQISEFQNENPGLFDEIFGRCGWSIKQEGSSRIYYSSTQTENREITGQELYNFIKKGFQETDSGFPKESKALASIAHAMINEEYQKKQVVDFIGRLHTAIAKKPNTYIKPARDFFQSRLGRALVLDHDVNAPGNVSADLGTSIDTLRARHPGLSTDPAQWGAIRSQYETELIQIYGPSRHMNSATERYNTLRGLL